jgi:hypothetical protein
MSIASVTTVFSAHLLVGDVVISQHADKHRDIMVIT